MTPSSMGGIRVRMGRCEICGGEDRAVPYKCTRCGKRACDDPGCHATILDTENCRVPKKDGRTVLEVAEEQMLRNMKLLSA